MGSDDIPIVIAIPLDDCFLKFADCFGWSVLDISVVHAAARSTIPNGLLCLVVLVTFFQRCSASVSSYVNLDAVMNG